MSFGFLYKNWQEPDSIVARASLIQTSVSFIERAENISKQLYEYQINLNTQIKNQVNRVNELGEEIKKLNLKIRQYESTGVERANDLRDQRNVCLDELGKIINITYKENKDGIVTVNAEGVAFVTEDIVYRMDAIRISEDSEMLKPVWVAHGNNDVFHLDRAPSSMHDTDVGFLKGLLAARGYKSKLYRYPQKRILKRKWYKAAVSHYNEINSSMIRQYKRGRSINSWNRNNN